MIDHDLFVQALRTFVSTMARSYDMTELCHQLCDVTTEVLGTAGAGVGVAGNDGRFRFVTATTERIAALERVQEETQQGPCPEAFRTGQPVVIDDLGSTDRWPDYRAVAQSDGFHAVVGHPLTVGDSVLGAFNVYEGSPREWTEEELSVIGVFADMVTASLVRVSDLQEATRLAEQLQGALDSRVVIEQAKGMIANQRGLSIDRAFQVLRRHARRNDLELSVVAEAVVTMGLEVPDSPE